MTISAISRACSISADADLGQAERRDLAFVLQRRELAELVRERDLRVDAVQLEQVDALDTESPKAHLDLLGAGKPAEPLSATRPGPVAYEPGLRGDEQVCRIGVQGLAQDLLASRRARTASAVSMKSTPSSTARRTTRMHSSRSSGSPQMPGPVSRMAPKPRRCTVLSPIAERAGLLGGNGGRGVGHAKLLDLGLVPGRGSVTAHAAERRIPTYRSACKLP